MQGYCDVYKWTILKQMSPEVKCLHPTSSSCEMCTSSVSNMIYQKFSHGATFYLLNGKHVNVMLESSVNKVYKVTVILVSVVQSIVSFTSSLRSHLVKCFRTL